MTSLLRYTLFVFLLGSHIVHAQNLPRHIEPSKQSLMPSLPILNVQASSPIIQTEHMEEQIRRLTGRVEDLGFQMLQMQEQMRQMQQDNEYRFQELEQRKNSDQATISPKIDRPNTNDKAGGKTGDVTPDNNVVADGDITLKSNENSPLILANEAADKLYKKGYSEVIAGDYAKAILTFGNYIEQYPDSSQLADAYFWQGEAQYSLGKFKDAARTFLDAHQAFPDADKAPDTLLKLGMSLTALDSPETACATFNEVLARYPSASKVIKDKVKSEQSRAQC